MCQIAMVVFGIVTLARGKFTLTGSKEVVGWPAYVIGILLLLPLPIAFGIGIIVGIQAGFQGGDLNENALSVLELGIVAGFLIAALTVALVYATPTDRRGGARSQRIRDEDDYDDEDEEDYDRRRRRKRRGYGDDDDDQYRGSARGRRDEDDDDGPPRDAIRAGR